MRKILTIIICLLSFIQSIFGKNIIKIQEIKDPIKQIEEVLSLSEKFGNDTVTLKKNLNAVLSYAEKENNLSLKWAYYIQMADLNSIIYDYTNPTSDNYYHLAGNLAKENKFTELEMVGLIRQAYYNFVYRKVINAFPYYLRANDLKSKVNISNIPLSVQHYQFSAHFFSYINDFNLAIQYLKDALPFSPPTSRVRVNLLNSMGIYAEKLNNTEKSNAYYHDAIKEATLAKDSVWIGIISGNLATSLWNAGRRNDAIKLVKKNIELSMQYNELQDAMRANLTLAEYYIALKEWQLAETHVKMGMKLMEPKPYYLQYHMNATYSLSKIAKGLNNKIGELRHLNKYLLLRDSLEKRNNFNELQRIIWKSERDKYDSTIKDVEEKRLQTLRTYIYISIFSILLFCIIILLINKSRIRIKIKNTLLEKEQLKLSFEKKLVDQEVVILKESLKDFTNTINRNNLLIKQLREDIEQQSLLHNDTQVLENHLNNLLEAHIMNDERWVNFKIIFEKVYPGYLNEMWEVYEKLSENDLKILALQKLGLNNLSMSEMLCVSVEGIKKAKQRLKKKMETSDI